MFLQKLCFSLSCNNVARPPLKLCPGAGASPCARGHSFKGRRHRAQFHKVLPGTGSHITCTVNLDSLNAVSLTLSTAGTGTVVSRHIRLQKVVVSSPTMVNIDKICNLRKTAI